MTFNVSKISYEDSIKIGADDAPVKVVEYINLRCPYSKAYEEQVAPSLNEWIENGQVQRVLKHFDKEKENLEPGNILHQYLNYETPKDSYKTIQKIFKHQDDWGKERPAYIPHVAKDKLDLSLQSSNKERSKRVLEEVKAVSVEYIPTVFVGQEAFVGTADIKEFHQAVEQQVKQTER